MAPLGFRVFNAVHILGVVSVAICAPILSTVQPVHHVAARATVASEASQYVLTPGLICALVLIAFITCLLLLAVVKYVFIRARRTILLGSIDSKLHVDPFTADSSYFANSSSSIGTQPASDADEKSALSDPFFIGLLGSPVVRARLLPLSARNDTEDYTS